MVVPPHLHATPCPPSSSSLHQHRWHAFRLLSSSQQLPLLRLRLLSPAFSKKAGKIDAWRVGGLRESRSNNVCFYVNSRRINIACEAANEVKPTCNMIVSITGATGFIGTRLVERLASDGHRVRVLTRSASTARSLFPVKQYPGVEIVEESDWVSCIHGSTAVVNLAGTPISTRWSPEIKDDIMRSRVGVTTKVVEAINAAPKDLMPSVFVSATAVGFYGTSQTHVFDESSPAGKDYLAEVCREWESTAEKVDCHVRLVLIRIGIVLDKDGGALAKMIPLFKIFAGGPAGSGKQWFSWVHRDDLVSLIVEALSNPSYKGVVNGTAPHPVRLAELCDQLGAILGRPSWLSIPDFFVQAVFGEGSYVVICGFNVLEGQCVLPRKALELGFMFKYRYLADALKAILS
eukprot:c27102_g1_i3 orf=500-1711(-)